MVSSTRSICIGHTQQSNNVVFLDGENTGPDEYVEQMTTFLEQHYLAAIHATIVSAEDQEKDYALAVK